MKIDYLKESADADLSSLPLLYNRKGHFLDKRIHFKHSDVAKLFSPFIFLLEYDCQYPSKMFLILASDQMKYQ